MGLTERHWFEDEDVPENYEWTLEDAVYNSRATWESGEIGMTKLEKKVLKGLECCKTDPTFESDCEDKGCPYKTDLMQCINHLCADALELLKKALKEDK